MKKIWVLGLMTLFLFTHKAEAQLRLGLTFNVGTQPEWGPVGYDRVDYYYLPDVDAYYYVPQKQFIYLEGNDWVFRNSLPGRYRDYDLYNGYKVIVNEPRPYLRDNYYRTNYGHFRNWQGQRQIVLRDRRPDRIDFRNEGRRNDNRDHRANNESRRRH